MRIQIHYRNNHKTETFYGPMEFIDYLNKSKIARSKIFKYTYDFPSFERVSMIMPKQKGKK